LKGFGSSWPKNQLTPSSLLHKQSYITPFHFAFVGDVLGERIPPKPDAIEIIRCEEALALCVIGCSNARVFNQFSFFVVSIAGWMKQHQQQVIEYLKE
jgi:hypothetical protein